MTEPVSRRAFFGRATVGATTTALATAQPPPSQAWIIVRVEWQHNDEYSYEAGTSAESTLFFDKDLAEAECRRRNHKFFTVDYPTPKDFDPDWLAYGFGPTSDHSEEAVTWDELREEGFPDPFFVQELSVPEATADE
jgi:hypothetical protein